MLRTADKTLFIGGVSARFPFGRLTLCAIRPRGISPHGTHFLYWKDSTFQVYDLEANATRTLGVATPPVSFIDVEDDHPGTKPSFGVTGHPSTVLGMALSDVAVRQSSRRPS